MLIIISPAKTQDFSPSKVKEFSSPALLGQSLLLVKELREYDASQISKLMDISESIAKLNVLRYKNFSPPFNLENAKQALLAFKGDVYTGIEADNYNKLDYDFASQHLRILSGLYGLLKPLDLIQAYRLEMKTKLANLRGRDLYHFWGDLITDGLNLALKEAKSDILLNLASVEYFSAIRPSKLKAKIITANFKEYKNGKYSIVAIHAKRARGLMANYIIKNKITAIDKLKNFTEAGYSFNKELSRDSELIFTR
jgi:cytoplasmic iron level regulating protein YaaA (DUF328/UPF0246 family)